MDAQVVIVGGGGTGGALAHDLTLRGLRVTLVERGELTSGTTGRHHGLLHSGARYAVGDPDSAIECIEENAILRAICPGSFEENDGLFVALTDEDMEYYDDFVEACKACGIPIEELDLVVDAGAVTGVTVRDHVTGSEGDIHADLVVNATGPWSEKIAHMAG